MASSDESVMGRQVCCFHEWMELQKQELSELQQARTLDKHDDSLSQLTGKCVQHFKDYMSRRSALAANHVSTYFSPTWCSSLENSLLWIGGCRPTIFIRLIYAFCGFDSVSELTEFLRGNSLRGSGSDDQNQNPSNFGWLVGEQLHMVDNLHRRTIKEEEKMTSRLASLQEEVCDEPLVMIATQASSLDEVSHDSEKELDVHAKSMARALEEADELRLKTLQEILVILTPAQAVDYLAASKKFRLCMHEWGMRRDQLHGRKN